MHKREIIPYFLNRLFGTLFLILAGILFALTLSHFINIDIIYSLKQRVNPFVQILYAELIGFVAPGPRYIIYPILIKLKEFGLNIGVIIALISGHVLIEPSTFFIETGFFGYKFPLKRFIVSLIITYFVGFITVILGKYFL